MKNKLTLKEVLHALWKGETEMAVAWLMLIIGLLFGWGLKVC